MYLFYIKRKNDFDNVFLLHIISLNKFVCKTCKRNCWCH